MSQRVVLYKLVAKERPSLYNTSRLSMQSCYFRNGLVLLWISSFSTHSNYSFHKRKERARTLQKSLHYLLAGFTVFPSDLPLLSSPDAHLVAKELLTISSIFLNQGQQLADVPPLFILCLYAYNKHVIEPDLNHNQIMN